MADRLARELERHFKRSAYQADDDLVFCHPHTGHVLEPSTVTKRFKRTLNRAGLRELTFHELRHTFGTQMAAVGTPLRAIQEWMGHADAKTTEVYRHYAPDPTHGASLVERAFGNGSPDERSGSNGDQDQQERRREVWLQILDALASRERRLTDSTPGIGEDSLDHLEVVQAVEDLLDAGNSGESAAKRQDREGRS
jgi:hypothetical protein